MRSGADGALFVWGALVRLSPDSARIKNTVTNMIASQKIDQQSLANCRSW